MEAQKEWCLISLVTDVFMDPFVLQGMSLWLQCLFSTFPQIEIKPPQMKLFPAQYHRTQI